MTPVRWALAAGVAVGFAYTLSPVTIIVIGLLFPLWLWASDGLDDTERRWLTAVFVVAIALSILFGAISGVYPAWRMSRLDPVDALQGGAR